MGQRLQPYNGQRAPLMGRPVSAADWQPYFEKALTEYATEQRGEVTKIDVKRLLTFMKSRRYPEFASEGSAANLCNKFLSRFFGPTWDGVKYRSVKHHSGRSLLMGTDNVLDFIRYRGAT